MRTRRSQLEQTYATDVITPTQLQPPWLQGQAVYPSGEREEDDDLDAEDDQEDQESPSKFVYPEPPSPPQTYESPNYGSAVEVMPADPALNNESSIGDGDEEEHFFNALLAEPDDRSDPDYSFMNEHDGSSDEIMSDEYRDEPEGRREPKRGRGGKRGSRGRGGRGRGNRITTPKRSEAARGRDDVLTSSPPPTTDWQVEPQGSNRRKRRKVTIEPSKEFRELQGKAHEAFVNMDFEEANRLAAEAQQENPEIFTNYVLRSEIYSAWGHPKKAVDILKHGSAFTRDPETLFRIAVRLGDFYTEPGTREWTLLRSIYTRILTEYYDPDHVGARTKRLEMWEKQDSPSMVVRDCLALLKQTPWDTYTLQKLSRWASKAGKLTAVPEAFEASIRYFKAVEKKGGQNFFDFSTVNIYMDVLYELEDFEKGVHGLRQLARWLVGRQDDTFWDPQPDDREWDIDDEPRRIQVPSFTAGKFEKSAYGEGLPLDLRILLGLFRLRLGPGHLAEAKQHCNFLKPDDASVDSLVTDYHDLFRDVGDAFRKLDHHSEALRYYKPLLQIPEACDESFYDAIIACYKGTGQPAQANQHYEQLIQIAKLSWRVKLEFAKHLMSLGDREAAMKYTNDVFSARPQYVYKAGLGDLIDRTKYRNVLPRYTGNEEEESTEALVARQRFVAPGYRRVRAKTNLHQIRPQEEQSALLPQTREVVHKKFMRLKELQPEVDAKIPHAQAEWMRTAEFMVEQFGSIDKLYPKRDKAKRFTGLERKPSKGWSPDDIPDDYSNVLFDEWVEIFCRLALLQASLGKKLMDHQRIDLENMRKTRAERVGDNDDDDGDDNDAPIDSVVAAAKTKGNRKKFKKPSSNSACWRTLLLAEGAHPIFENKQRTAKVHATWLACALIDNDEHNICVETRQLIKDHPHASDAYKIYSAANRLFSGTRSWLNGGPNQKFLLREIKKMDFALLPEDKRASYLYTDAERRTWINNGGNGNPDGLTELDPAMLALYAHMMVAGGQAQNALYYYFRALAILPEDPVLHLCIATCYVEHAFKRLSDNRTYWTQLGISFLFKYYDLRTKDGSKLHTQEAEFNIGRTWHHLGLLHLAIPRYEKVLEMHEEVEYEANALGVEGKDREAESFAAEAAYALSTILAVSGSVADARRLREKWLVL